MARVPPTDEERTAVLAQREARVEAYEQRTSFAMVVLALVYLGIFTIQVLATGLSQTQQSLLNIVSNGIWLSFVIDLVIRVVLAPRRIDYLVHHPIDVIAVVIPAFRALRVLRVITAGQWLVQRGARLAVGRAAMAICVAVVFLALLGALSVLSAERGAPGSNINSFGEALWWAAETISTVGYGDAYPVTFEGRIVAVGLMVLGISLLGIVSAGLASSLLTRLRGEQDSEIRLVLRKLDALEKQLADLHTRLGDNGTTPATDVEQANGHVAATEHAR